MSQDLDHEVDILIEELEIPKSKEYKKKLQFKPTKQRLELFLIRMRRFFENLYEFCFLAILSFFCLNLILIMMTITYVYIILALNHIIIPLAHTAGIY